MDDTVPVYHQFYFFVRLQKNEKHAKKVSQLMFAFVYNAFTREAFGI